MRTRATLFVVLTLLTAAGADAQGRLGPVQRRPRLPAGADTNDANAYFSHAQRLLNERPAESALAFYWAARLDPSSSEALDGRRASAILGKLPLMKLYFEGGRRRRDNKELKALDSLELRALRLDPLYYRKYDQAMLNGYFTQMLRQENPTASPAEIQQWIDQYLATGSPSLRAWVAYGEGRFAHALELYEVAAKQARNAGSIRLERARILALQGQYPAALAEFRVASELLAKRENDRDENVVFYDSRALLEHSMGIIFARMGQVDSAKAALGRAITEDLSYFMAHVELGRLALAEKDTATAVSELALAADLAADEPYVHYLRGGVLFATGQLPDAIAAYKKVLELEPLHSASQYELAMALERTGDKAAAREGYQRYLTMAATRDSRRREAAAERVAALAP